MSCHVQVMGQYEEIVEVGAGGCRQEHSGPEELEVATRRERLPKEYSSYALSKGVWSVRSFFFMLTSLQ